MTDQLELIPTPGTPPRKPTRMPNPHTSKATTWTCPACGTRLIVGHIIDPKIMHTTPHIVDRQPINHTTELALILTGTRTYQLNHQGHLTPRQASNTTHAPAGTTPSTGRPYDVHPEHQCAWAPQIARIQSLMNPHPLTRTSRPIPDPDAPPPF